MTESGFRPTGTPDLAVAKSHNDFAMLEPREQLATLLKEHVVGRPFSELAAVTFDHRAATVMGHVLIDALEDAGYSIDDFDAVGALTAASVPMVSAMIQAAASRGEDLDGFVMDFVYPSINGPLHRRPPCGAVGCLAVRKVVRADQLAGHPAQRQ